MRLLLLATTVAIACSTGPAAEPIADPANDSTGEMFGSESGSASSESDDTAGPPPACGEGGGPPRDDCDDGSDGSGSGGNDVDGGRELWVTGRGGPGYGVCIDADGNINVAGFHGTASESADDAYVWSFSMDGEERWIHRYGGGGTQLGRAIACSAEGMPTMVGQESIEGQSLNGLVLRLDASGDVDWQDSIHLGPLGSSIEDPWAVDYDHDGGLYVAGMVRRAGLATNGFVRKYGSDNEVRWTTELPGELGAPRVTVAVAAAPGGDVVAGGWLAKDEAATAWLARLDSAGAIVWTREYDQLSPASVFNSVYVTDDDEIVVGGAVQVEANFSSTVFALDATGQDVLWSLEDLLAPGQIGDVAIAPDGTMVVVGRNDLAYDMTEPFIARYDADRERLWSDTQPPSEDWAVLVGVDHGPNGEIVAVGTVDELPLDPAWGFVMWARRYSP